jgi:hypothetical protein
LSSPRRCRGCKTWRSCQGYSFYEPAEVVYCRVQMLWLIEWLPTLEEGKYPPDPTPTGYIDHGFGGIKAQAPFELSCQIAGEVSVRLKKAGKDGRTLEHEVRELNAHSYELLSPAAKDALNYCSGWKRKRRTFPQWLADRTYKKVINLSPENRLQARS